MSNKKNKKKNNSSVQPKKNVNKQKNVNVSNSKNNKIIEKTNDISKSKNIDNIDKRFLDFNRRMDYNKKNSSSFNEKKSIKINTADVYSSGIHNNVKSQNVNKNLNSNKNVSHFNNSHRSKDVSSGEAIDKMISMGKSFFINGTIFIAVSTIAIGGTIFLTGYDPVPLIEKHFIYTSNKDNTEENIITKLTSLDISKDLPTEDIFSKYYDFVNVDLGDILLNEELFNQGRQAFNAEITKFYSENYITDIESDDVLYNALSNIYEGESRYPYSLSLTSIGKVVRNSKALTKLSVDINAVDDDLGFHVWNLALFMDNNGKITDIKVLAENKTLKNTRTPLSPSLSIITNGIKDSTTRSVNSFLKGITNENLYNKLAASGKSFNTAQLKAFFSKLNLNEIDYDTLSEMFEVSKGNGSNFAITEVISTDFDGEPITNIILSLKLDDYVYRYDLQYNRREKALIKVSKL